MGNRKKYKTKFSSFPCTVQSYRLQSISEYLPLVFCKEMSDIWAKIHFFRFVFLIQTKPCGSRWNSTNDFLSTSLSPIRRFSRKVQWVGPRRSSTLKLPNSDYSEINNCEIISCLGEASFKKNWFFSEKIQTSETPPPPPINLDGQIFSVNRNFGLAETPPP